MLFVIWDVIIYENFIFRYNKKKFNYIYSCILSVLLEGVCDKLLYITSDKELIQAINLEGINLFNFIFNFI
jgi:rRNA-processing protein FCF1